MTRTDDSVTIEASRALAGFQRQRFFVGGVLIISLVLNAIPMWWGLPNIGNTTWAFDELQPDDLGNTAVDRHQGRYPPLHYYVLRVLYSPLRALNRFGVIHLDGEQLRTALQLIGRGLSVLLATGTVYLIFRIGCLLYNPCWAAIAALVSALTVPFAFYAKTINLEAPYIFWFVWSIYFLVRVQRTHKLSDYVAFGATMACSIATKDQAYALYGFVPLLMLWNLHNHRHRVLDAPGTLLDTLADRRIVWSAAVAISVFALVHNLLFDWQGFARHLQVVTGNASESYQRYSDTWQGHVQMLTQAVRHLGFAMGWPLLMAAVIGIPLAVRDRNGKLLSLLCSPISYYLLFIMPILYHYVRFLLPICVVLSLFAGRSLGELSRIRTGRVQAGWVAVALLLGSAFLRPLSLDMEMLADSRYYLEDSLGGDKERFPKVMNIGLHRQYFPRRGEWTRLARAAAGGLNYLRAIDADVLVVNPAAVDNPGHRRFLEKLLSGELNYTIQMQPHRRPWLPPISRQGVFTNLTTVNPELTVLTKTKDWGLSDEALSAALVGLRNRDQRYDWQSTSEMIFTGPPSNLRSGVGSTTVTFGLSPDRWTRGTRTTAIVIGNSADRAVQPTLLIGCGASPEDMPVIATVRGETSTFQVRFDERGVRRIDLGILAPGSREMYLVYSDSAWSPAREHTKRRLGASVRRGRDRRVARNK